MANNEEVFNARISSANLSIEHGVWTSCIQLDGGAWSQMFGGFALKGEAMHIWVDGVCAALGVEDWAGLPHNIVRGKREGGPNGRIVAIGHPIEDKWFTPSEAFAHLTEKKAS